MLRALAVLLVTLAVILGPAASTVHSTESPSAKAAEPAAGDPAGDDRSTANQSNTEQLPPAPTTSSPDEDAAAEAALLASINESRKEAGVAPVRTEETLCQAARLHAKRMVAAQQLEHQFPGEPSLLPRFAAVSPLQLDRAGENIADASGSESATSVLMHSPPHRANILDPNFNVVGVAAIWTQGRLYVVQDFAHALPANSTQETARLIANAVRQARANAELPELSQFTPPHLDEAACEVAKEGHPAARSVASIYSSRKVITYTQSHPEVLPGSAQSSLKNPDLSHFAIGACYARNATHPAGIYWVAILLY